MDLKLTATTLWDMYQTLPKEEQEDILAILLRKQPLSTDALIQHMKAKGITFNIVSEDAAKEFLENHNYYFKLAAYRGNYTKYQRGIHAGKYENLDFAYLKELSTIDMHLRYLILQMCLDIEHQLKVMLINEIDSNPVENGYGLIHAFDTNVRCRQKIIGQANNSYATDLIQKHQKRLDFPIWALCELISFGDLCRLYKTYVEMYPERKGLPKHSLLNPIRNLRNAAAHSNCLIYKLKAPRATTRKTLPAINNIVAQIPNISRSSRKDYLRIIPIHDFTVLLYWYYTFVKNVDLKRTRSSQLKNLFYHRMLEHKSYFQSNPYIKHAYIFTARLVHYFSSIY